MPNVNTRSNLNLLDLFIPAIFDSNTTLQTKKFPKKSLTLLISLRASTHQIPAHSLLPSTSILHKPLLTYHFAFQSSTSASAIEVHLTATVWLYLSGVIRCTR